MTTLSNTLGKVRGPPFDFSWGVWVILEKNMSSASDWFRGKKILARKSLAKKKKISHWKKKAFKAYNPGKIRRASGKKILSPEIYQKNYFSNQITRTPRPLLNLIKWLAVIVDTSSRSVSVVGQHKQRQNRGFPCKGKQFSPNDQIHGWNLRNRNHILRHKSVQRWQIQ